MLNTWKFKIFIALVICSLVGCAKGLSYSVIKAFVSSWNFIDSGGINNSAPLASYSATATLGFELYLFYEDANGLRTATYQGFQSWDLLSGFYSVQPSASMGAPSIIVFNSKIYGAWTEVAQAGVNTGKSQNHVSVTSGFGTWSVVDPSTSCGSINCLSFTTSENANNPVLASNNGKLYAAWSETTSAAPAATQIRAAVYDGNDGSPDWSGVTSPTLNRDPEQNATFPQLVSFNSKLYAAWSEVSSPIYGPSNNTAMTTWGSGQTLVFFSDILNGNRGTVVSQNNGNWNTMGPAGFTPGATSYNAIATDNFGNIYVAFQDGANSGSVTVMKFSNNTNSWSFVGPVGFTSANANYVSLAIDSSGTPYVAFEDSNVANKASVMKFSGGAWTFVGVEGLSTGSAFSVSLAIDSVGNLYVGYEDGSLANKATVQEFQAGAWSVLGSSGFSAGGVQYISLKIGPVGNVPFISYEDSGNGGKATVQTYNGAAWVAVGAAGFSSAQAFYTSLAFDTTNNPYIVFEDAGSSNKATVMSYNGAAWVNFPVAGISNGAVGHTTIAVDSTTHNPIVAYEDTSLGAELIVQKYNGTVFQPLNSFTNSQIRFAVYNGNDGSPGWQYIDGGNVSGINFNKSLNATSPTFIVYQGRLYLSWIETNGTANQVRVAVYGGNDSSPNGFMVDGNGPNGLNFDSTKNVNGPLSSAVFFNKLYLSWSEATSGGNYVIHMKAYNGNDSAPAWTFVDGGTSAGLSANPSNSGQWPTLAVYFNNLYSFWIESVGLPPSSGTVHAAVGD